MATSNPYASHLVNQINIPSVGTYFLGSNAYLTCSSNAETVAKEVPSDSNLSIDYLFTGMTVHILFTNSNTASNPTLNLCSLGAKPIYLYGTTSPGNTPETSWFAGSVISLTYTGSAWIINDYQFNSGGSGGSDGNQLITTATLTVAGWSNNTQTVSVTGVTTTNAVLVTYALTSKEQYLSNGIYCSAQGTGSLTFTCTITPTVAIDVNVMVFIGTVESATGVNF